MFKCCNEGHSPSSHFDLKRQNFCILIKNFLTTFTAQFAVSLRFLYNFFILSLSLSPLTSRSSISRPPCENTSPQACFIRSLSKIFFFTW